MGRMWLHHNNAKKSWKEGMRESIEYTDEDEPSKGGGRGFILIFLKSKVSN